MAEDDDRPAAREEQLLQTRAERFAKVHDDRGQDLRRLIRFRRGATQFAIELERSLEIRMLQRFCEIPGASPAVPGVFYHRGRILSGHDLGVLFQPGASLPAASWVIICVTDGWHLGLLADEVRDVEEYAPEDVRAVPVTFGRFRDCVAGMLESGVMLLDLEELAGTQEFVEAS